MIKKIIFLALIICIATKVNSLPKESWNYVDVRQGAHMFYWMYRAQLANAESAPLVLWLQGGPGASGVGFGNFEEIGPLNVNLQHRNTTWLKHVNLIFVDNPVGAGYSYVDSDDLYTTSEQQIASDLVSIFQNVTEEYPETQKMPFYVFCESYGGKMTTSFGNALVTAIKRNKIKMNFKGVGLGDSWISGVDSVKSWGPYLYALSNVNKYQLANLNDSANQIEQAVKNGQYVEATQMWGSMEGQLEDYTDEVDFYYVLNHNINDFLAENKAKFAARTQGMHPDLARLYKNYVLRLDQQKLSNLMNGPIRQKLGIIPSFVTWGGSSGDVFQHLNADFMQPVISGVDKLIESGISVNIFSGQLDLICDVLGTYRWMDKMQWRGMNSFFNADKTSIILNDGSWGGSYQEFKNLHFYILSKSGHMCVGDKSVNGNPEAGLFMLKRILKGN